MSGVDLEKLQGIVHELRQLADRQHEREQDALAKLATIAAQRRGPVQRQMFRTCDHCGEPIVARSNTKRFCSDRCRTAWHKTPAALEQRWKREAREYEQRGHARTRGVGQVGSAVSNHDLTRGSDAVRTVSGEAGHADQALNRDT